MPWTPQLSSTFNTAYSNAYGQSEEEQKRKEEFLNKLKEGLIAKYNYTPDELSKVMGASDIGKVPTERTVPAVGPSDYAGTVLGPNGLEYIPGEAPTAQVPIPTNPIYRQVYNTKTGEYDLVQAPADVTDPHQIIRGMAGRTIPQTPDQAAAKAGAVRDAQNEADKKAGKIPAGGSKHPLVSEAEKNKSMILKTFFDNIKSGKDVDPTLEKSAMDIMKERGLPFDKKNKTPGYLAKVMAYFAEEMGMGGDQAQPSQDSSAGQTRKQNPQTGKWWVFKDGQWQEEP